MLKERISVVKAQRLMVPVLNERGGTGGRLRMEGSATAGLSLEPLAPPESCVSSCVKRDGADVQLPRILLSTEPRPRLQGQCRLKTV